jgi:exosortase
LHDERYSYILLVPFISGFLIWIRRERIVGNARYCPRYGIPLLLSGASIALIAGKQSGLDKSETLSVTILAVILIWTAIVVLCFGTEALNASIFPLVFLLLFIPIPANVMQKAVVAVQTLSAGITAVLFKIVGLPFARDGFRFSLSSVDIEISEQCSGIRSTFSVFLCGILASHMFLRRGWTRVSFALLTIPVVVFKNAVRIATIAWLGVNVSPDFFTGNLHRYGGLPFSPVVIALLIPILLALRNAERWSVGPRKVDAVPPDRA